MIRTWRCGRDSQVSILGGDNFKLIQAQTNVLLGLMMFPRCGWQPLFCEDRAAWHRKWTHLGLNPGPSACGADVIPRHHVPLKLSRAGQEVGRYGRVRFNAILLATHRVNALMNTSVMHFLGWRTRSQHDLCFGPGSDGAALKNWAARFWR